MPPEQISPYLDSGWDNCNRTVTVHKITGLDDENNDILIDLSDNNDLRELYDEWLIVRNEWAEQQKLINQVQGTFENIY